MTQTEAAIARVKRDLAMGAMVRTALLVFVLAGMLLSALLQLGRAGYLAVLVVWVAWLVLSFRSMRSQRMAAGSAPLIAAGEYELAERQIEGALRSFSVFRSSKLLGLHNLAVLRHAQRRWAEAVLLCRAVLAEKPLQNGALTRTARLVLADSLLELNDVAGAYEAISGLYRERLSLGEALRLVRPQLDYESRIGAWAAMCQGMDRKVQLAELMPSDQGARTLALLALAARKLGRDDAADYLRRRAELLASPDSLIGERPLLAELWPADRASDGVS